MAPPSPIRGKSRKTESEEQECFGDDQERLVWGERHRCRRARRLQYRFTLLPQARPKKAAFISTCLGVLVIISCPPYSE